MMQLLDLPALPQLSTHCVTLHALALLLLTKRNNSRKQSIHATAAGSCSWS
jgi:hypothetical protein